MTGKTPSLESDEVRIVLRQLDDWARKGMRSLQEGSERGPIRELHLELTHRCNLRCGMCHHWEQPFKDPASVHREMGLEGIRRLVAQSRALDGVRRVVISGGEPMIHPDFDAITRCLLERFSQVELTILTNLWNTELVRRRLESFEENLRRRLSIGASFDGIGKTHDHMRGQAGAYAGLEGTVAMLRAEFPSIPLSFNFTITPKNFTELWKSYLFVTERWEAWFGAQLVVNHQGCDAPETYQWSSAERSEVAEQIDRIIADLCRRYQALDRLVRGEEAGAPWLWERILYWRYLKEYALRPRRFFKDCMAGERFAMLDPEGNLFYCPVNKHRTIGSVQTQALDDLWVSPKAEEERRYVESCRCDCWLNCVANPILERVVARGASTPEGSVL